MTQEHLQNEEAIKKLNELVKDVKVCMFATINTDNTLFSRPMYTMEIDTEGNIWFFTNDNSAKIDDVSKENTVYLMYSHPGHNTYVHVKGNASVVHDKQKIKELWSPAVKAWFPGGENDPALCLLKVETQEASYWDGTSNKFVVFFNMLKAIAKGDKPDNGQFGDLKVNNS